MNHKVRTELIEVARSSRGYIHYQELSDKLGLGFEFRFNEYHRKEIGILLGEITQYEYEHQRPLLSALVLGKSGGDEGDGFFKLCEQLGLGPWRKLKKDPAFASLKMKECYDFWRDDTNYLNHKDG